MRRTKLFVWVLAAALLLCACTGRPNQNLPDGRSDLTKWVVSERQVEIPSQTVEHGEDYVIQWEDPAMEAHIRFVLNKSRKGTSCTATCGRFRCCGSAQTAWMLHGQSRPRVPFSIRLTAQRMRHIWLRAEIWRT